MKKVIGVFLLVIIITGCAKGKRIEVADRWHTPPPVNTEKQKAIAGAVSTWRATQNGKTMPRAQQPAEKPAVESTGEVRGEVIPPTEDEQKKSSQKLAELEQNQTPPPPASTPVTIKQAKPAAVYDPRVSGLTDRVKIVEEILKNKVSAAGLVIKFRPGSVELSPFAKKELDRMVEDFTGGKINNIKLAGHASFSGSSARNQKLMEQREKAVKEYLVEKNVDVEIISGGETDQFGTNTNVAIYYDLVE